MSDILIYDLLTVRAFSAIAIASTLTVVFLTAAVFNSGDSHQNFINIIIVVVYLTVVIIIIIIISKSGSNGRRLLRNSRRKTAALGRSVRMVLNTGEFAQGGCLSLFVSTAGDLIVKAVQGVPPSPVDPTFCSEDHQSIPIAF